MSFPPMALVVLSSLPWFYFSFRDEYNLDLLPLPNLAWHWWFFVLKSD